MLKSVGLGVAGTMCCGAPPKARHMARSLHINSLAVSPYFIPT